MLNKNKNNSTIKSMIFSGLLAFGIMGVNDGFSSNYVNNIFDICEQNSNKKISFDSFKSDIITILNSKINGQTLYDFLVSSQKKGGLISEENANRIRELFKSSEYHIEVGIADYYISFKTKLSDIDIDACDARCCTISIATYASEKNKIQFDTNNRIFLDVIKQPNGEYKFEQNTN